MPAERFYTPVDLMPGQEVVLTHTESHHLAHVMRVKPGEEVELVNGRGSLAKAKVMHLSKKEAKLRIESVLQDSQTISHIILAQAIPRINRLDVIVEKGTELGMTQLWLFPGERSERKSLSTSQLERLKALSIASMKQCGRLHLPHIELKPALYAWTQPKGKLFFGDLSPSAPLLISFLPLTNTVFFIGPESGFTEKEIEKLKEFQAQGVKLHQNILRTDTAAIVMLGVITQ